MPVVSAVQGIKDPYQQASSAHWKTQDANALAGAELVADVVIIGSGAGGGTSAEIFSQAGLSVIILEEGPLKTSSSFDMDERSAYQDLYQENAGRMSKDGGISILQGRCVGGTTVINWTSSFRTPEPTLQHWQQHFQVQGCSAEALAPWFEKMEQRLSISPWQMPANANNQVLSDGCDQLGIPWQVIPRNVSGCWNLGYCGTGCPTNAKQSMLTTTIPSALQQGATLVYNAHAHKLQLEAGRVSAVSCSAVNGIQDSSQKNFSVRAKYVVSACGGINGPALLLRSKVPDPHQRIGKRTFLHPVAFSFAQFEQEIEPFYGAPQAVYSDHFQWPKEADDAIGFKLEVPPLHPGLASVLLMGHGQQHVDDMKDLSHTSAMIALMRDGFHEHSIGASIELADDGSAIIDYDISEYVWQGVQRAHLNMAEIQFAAGAKRVRPAHQDGRWFHSFAEFKQAQQHLAYRSNSCLLGCAHVMGGLAMGQDQQQCSVDSDGKYHHLDNLYVFDGSVFPTSIGANPQLSIYALAAKWAHGLSEKIQQQVL